MELAISREKKKQEKNRELIVCCETTFSKNSYHKETSQLICVANQAIILQLMKVFFPTGFNFAGDETTFSREFNLADRYFYLVDFRKNR